MSTEIEQKKELVKKEIEAKKDLIVKEIDRHLEGFEKRRKYNRTKTFTTHMLIILLGGLVTFSNGLGKFEFFDIEMAEITQIISMILGVIITGIGAYNGFFNNKRFWVVYTSTTNGLKKIKSDLSYYIAGKPVHDIDLNKLQIIKDKIQEVLDETNSEWASVRNN